MESQILCYKKLAKNAYAPVRASTQMAEYDLFSVYDSIVQPHDKQLAYTDLATKVVNGCYGGIAAGSDLAIKFYIHVFGGALNSDHRGMY